MKRYLALCAGLFLAGCTTMQTRHTATADLAGVALDPAFKIATAAVIQAGFSITSSDKDAGLIIATRSANHVLTYENPAINISVVETGGSSRVLIASSVGGQLIDYGTSADTIRDFCAALAQAAPSAQCKLD